MSHVSNELSNFNNYQSTPSIVQLSSRMDHKLKAISNNVNNNDTIVEYVSKTDEKSEAKETTTTDHICGKNVPVLFASVRGIHLRKFNKSSPNNYDITFCDLERWVRKYVNGGRDIMKL